MTQQIIKEAYTIRTRIESGSINIPELLSFLKKIEVENKVPERKRRKSSFQDMLEYIDRTHKPLK